MQKFFLSLVLALTMKAVMPADPPSGRRTVLQPAFVAMLSSTPLAFSASQLYTWAFLAKALL